MEESEAQKIEYLAENFVRLERMRNRMCAMASEHFSPNMDAEDLTGVHQEYPRFEIGLSEVDARWGGAQGLTVLSARPGTGKSMLCVCAALLNADQGIPVFYFDAENSTELVQRRMRRFIGERKFAERMQAYARDGLLSYIKVRTGQEFRQLVRFVVERLQSTDALIITDSINQVAKKLMRRKEGYFEKINQILAWQDETCQLTDGSVRFLTLSEMNKGGDAKGMDAEHTCTMSIRLHRDEESGVVRVEIGKHRDGEGYLELGRYRRMVDTNQFERIVDTPEKLDVEFY